MYESKRTKTIFVCDYVTAIHYPSSYDNKIRELKYSLKEKSHYAINVS